MKALEVFQQSNGEITKRYYDELEKRGPIGLLALNLFRAQKTSTRAKLYRGRRYKSAAYDVKSWSMGNLAAILAQHAESLGIRYGWKQDPATVFGEEPSWVLYVDLPQGQVSFHSPTRISVRSRAPYADAVTDSEGPDYPGEWDGQRLSAARIIQFCDQVYAGKPLGSTVDAAANEESAGIGATSTALAEAYYPSTVQVNPKNVHGLGSTVGSESDAAESAGSVV